MNNGYFVCPNCGNMITESMDTCPNCTYDFGQLIDCNYLKTDKTCTLTDKPCKIKGLDYENCKLYNDALYNNKLPEL